jgi:hypothetical protein
VTARIRVDRHPADELTDAQIERLMGFGRQEAALIDELEQATRNGDRESVWKTAQSICRLHDKVNEEHSK